MKSLVLSIALPLFASGVTAEERATSGPNTFPTLAACSAALESGAFRYYEPKYFGLRTRNPVNGVDRITVPLESDQCLEMLVVGGRRFVVQREGTLFRAYRRVDGTLALYARHDCGNPVYGVVYPAPIAAPTQPLVQTPPARVVGPEPAAVWPVPGPVRGGFPQHPVPPEKKGFCSSKKCRWTVIAIAGAAAGYAAYYYWPCPPGTVRK